MLKLKQYLKDNNINQKDFAAEVGISEKHLSRILNGHSGVSVGLAFAIQNKTRSYIKAEDFHKKQSA